MMPESSVPRAPRMPDLSAELREVESSDGSLRERAFGWLTTLQLARPWLVLFIAALLTGLAATRAVRLEVRSGFEHLLPESRASVKELHRVAEKTAGVSTLFVVLQVPAEAANTPPTAALRMLADDIVVRLNALGPPWVGSAESGVQDAYEFMLPRAGLYADKAKLAALADDIEARYEYEVSKALDSLLDPDELPPPPISKERFESLMEKSEQGRVERYPEGYYQSTDGRTVVVAVRSKVHGSDFDRAKETIAKIQAVVSDSPLRNQIAGLNVRYGGDLQTAVSEFIAINKDLTEVGLTGALLIAASVFLFYLRLRTLFAMLMTITIGLSWTFGVTQMTLGHLNMATGFLFSIVAGNGINFGIIFMSRFLEERRQGRPLLQSIFISHRETWVPTLTAATAAGAAYASLLVTDFRGFRDFGAIGGVGMLLCWLATYWTLPAILVLIERFAPLKQASELKAGMQRKRSQGIAFGAPIARLIPRAPALICTVGALLGVVALAMTARYVTSDPMEYDLRNLRNDISARTEEIATAELAEDITGYVGADGMAIVTDRIEQVLPLKAALEARRDSAPPEARPFDKVHSLFDYIPADQDEKIERLMSIRSRVLRAHKRGMINEEDWKALEPVLPPEGLEPITLETVPDSIARAFTETDGTRGRIVYISPTVGEMIDDAHYLFRWADSYRETTLPDGSVVLGSGRAVIYADMWSSVLADVPKAVGVSLLATLLVCAFAFRKGIGTLAVAGSLLLGALWMAALIALSGVRINFLNFIALPITFGIGVDYAVNIAQRYVREGPGSVLLAVRETGGAVILCSLTTVFGYIALARSMNYAVRSLGIAAVIGEVACLIAALFVLPAALILFDKRKGITTAS